MLQGSETSSHGFEQSILVEISGHNCSGVLEEVHQLCLGLQPYDDPAVPEPGILSLTLVQAQPEPIQYFFVTTFNFLKTHRLKTLEPAVIRSYQAQTQQTLIFQEVAGDGVHGVEHVLGLHLGVQLQSHSEAEGAWLK